MFTKTIAQAVFSWVRERLAVRLPEERQPVSAVKLSPQVGLTDKSVEMIEAGLQPTPTPKEPEEPPLRGSLESRFPTTR